MVRILKAVQPPAAPIPRDLRKIARAAARTIERNGDKLQITRVASAAIRSEPRRRSPAKFPAQAAFDQGGRRVGGSLRPRSISQRSVTKSSNCAPGNTTGQLTEQ